MSGTHNTMGCSLSTYGLALIDATLVRHLAEVNFAGITWPNYEMVTPIGYPATVSMVQTILVFVIVPLAIYGAVGLITLRSKFSGGSRYRPGQEWNFAPVWWTANPKGLAAASDHAEPGPEAGAGVRGGASGRW